MCSICGYVDFNKKIDPKYIMEMNSSLSHRGPDQNGIAFGFDWCFGHNRLAVIDVEKGIQPMISEKNGYKYTIIYNGELYNSLELKNELLSLGHTFKTDCDTEVVLHAYMEWEEESPKRLNGIFAYGIYDELNHQVFLARDRLGVKPLFYSQKDSTVIFSSEIKAILKYEGMKAEIDRKGFMEVACLLPTRVPGSGVFKGINELEPASFMIIKKDKLIIQKYWEIEPKRNTHTYSEAVVYLRELLRDTVRRQIVSDVPLCTLLSGGLDSSTITCIASEELSKRNEILRTYSFDYEENNIYFKPNSFQPDSDNNYSLEVSKYSKTVHKVLTAPLNTVIDLLYEAVDKRDMPGMADIDSSLMYFCGEIKKNHTVALSGECADEIFGGYPWFHKEGVMSKNIFPWIYSLKDKIELFSPDIINLEESTSYVNSIYEKSVSSCPVIEGENYRDREKTIICWLNLNWFMVSLLERKDRMSMGRSLEVRVPFADHRIVEYVFSLPWSYKYKDNQPKSILRDAAKGIVPLSVVNRKKSPYPKTVSPNYASKVKSILDERLNHKDCILRDIINIKKLSQILESNTPWFGQLMSGPQFMAWLIQLDYWIEKYGINLIK
ncbi:asparagine synthase (glutamine-hydrolyzing) [Acidilutibacter cellobiosedens]|jgi:asparagine synthase (glutamine-hydrolysing)|uniref:asparagine synthase (glutamine-hydrolyzing) n=1 Tax=Acidilutibacter cellobiosedens TaxID=2507161 RepID=A0A410QE39_9FIRM|nr:asparagine synthase (glutamine-hydrolyzing) [Acidilutibacter cellobiosedens]QAT62261.1 asparagine synthase (glutamine-hydrolyzing) [Acidilutibacter cellobiosedens]